MGLFELLFGNKTISAKVERLEDVNGALAKLREENPNADCKVEYENRQTTQTPEGPSTMYVRAQIKIYKK